MKVLFARVGYMKYYNGPMNGDERPIKGGKYNDSEVGHELFNFKQTPKGIFGFFQPHMKKPYSIYLKRIDNQIDHLQTSVNDVLVIFIAKNPVSKGQIIVGWYRNATVYKNFQDCPLDIERQNLQFNLFTENKNAYLLPISARTFTIGHSNLSSKEGNPGESNVFYISQSNGQPKDIEIEKNSWISKAIDYVNSYDNFIIRNNGDIQTEEVITNSVMGQGFNGNIKSRLAIENYAMKCCENYYLSKGYNIKDHSSNKPYDFLVSRKDEEFIVEVKGTCGKAESIILTYNEVQLHENKKISKALYIRHSIKMKNEKEVEKGSGVEVILNPWELDINRLKPISYNYQLSDLNNNY